MSLVDTPAALADLTTRLQHCPVIALDTEFMRDRTWYARLCLVQIGDGERIDLVDPLAGDNAQRQLLPEAALLVIHSGEQDMEILGQAGWAIPQTLYDTQVAAAMVGESLQISYQGLVAQEIGVQLEKGEQRSDWARRPLSSSQQRYAADDVRYLHPLRERLDERLDKAGRSDWLKQDMQCWREQLANADDDSGDARAYLRIRAWPRLDETARMKLKALAGWREAEARRRDLPRGWLIEDRQLVELAEGAAIPSSLKPALKQGLASVLDGPLPTPEANALPLDERADRVQSLMASVRKTAKSLQIEPALIASRRDLEAYVAGEAAPKLALPWRRACLGEA